MALRMFAAWPDTTIMTRMQLESCLTQGQTCHMVSKHAGRSLTPSAACRWFPSDHIQAPQAAWLDIILYSREQLVAERAALPRSGPTAELPDAPWGIISIKVH